MSAIIVLRTEGADEGDVASTLKHVANLVEQGFTSGPLPGGKFEVSVDEPEHAVISDGDMTGWCQVHQVWEALPSAVYESREDAFEREVRAGTTGLGPGRVRMEHGEYPQQADEM